MLRYFTFPVTPFRQNCSVVHDDATKKAAVIDPGGDLDALASGRIPPTSSGSTQGDHGTLVASLTQRLWPMGDETVFIPGHGPESTFGRERKSNPYVGGT